MSTTTCEAVYFGVRRPVGALAFCDLSQPLVWTTFVETRGRVAERDGDRSPMTKAVTGHRTPKKELPILRRSFGVFEFFLPPPVAALLDQLPRSSEILERTRPWIRLHCVEQTGAVKVDVSYVQPHWPTLGDFPSLVQVTLRALRAGRRASEKAQPTTSEQGAWEVVSRVGPAKAVHRIHNVGGGHR